MARKSFWMERKLFVEAIANGAHAEHAYGDGSLIFAADFASLCLSFLHPCAGDPIKRKASQPRWPHEWYLR